MAGKGSLSRFKCNKLLKILVIIMKVSIRKKTYFKRKFMEAEIIINLK